MSDFSLDDLLSEALAESAEKKRSDLARKRVKENRLRKPEEVAEDARVLAAWEARHVWRDEANVAQFRENRCLNCNDYQQVFEGLFRRQSHRHLKDGSQRWIVVDNQDLALNNEIRVTETETPFCGECLGTRGFSWGRGYTDDGRQLVPAVPEVMTVGLTPDEAQELVAETGEAVQAVADPKEMQG